MKNLSKTFFVIVLSLAFVFITACGSSGSSSKNTPAPDKGEATEKPAESTAPKTDAKTYTMRVATPTNNDPQTYEMELFKKAIEAKTNGQIKVELYPASQLGSNAQMLQQLSAGSIQAMLEPTAFLGGFNELLTIVDIPYLWPDVYQAAEYLNGEGGKLFDEGLAQKGIVALRYYEYGPRTILLKNNVEKLDDLKGQKIRVMGAPVLVDEINKWGGSGIAMGVPELYTALQQGTIDGLESAAMFFYSGKYYENAKYLWMEPQGAEITLFMANKQWLDSLPADLQQAVKDASVEITEDAIKYARENNDKAIEEMKKVGITVIERNDEIHQQLVEATKPVIEEFEKRVAGSKEIIEKIGEHFNTK